jgi:hypothetical protein
MARRIPCRRRLGPAAFAVAVLALTTACSVFEDKPFNGEDEILYGPEAKPATVDCQKSGALDEFEEYENVWSCEIVLKDGSGRVETCWATLKSTDSQVGSFRDGCEAWAARLRSGSG